MNRNADAERFKAGIGTQMRKIKDAKYRNAKKKRLQGRQGIETQRRKGVRLLRNRNADDESSKAEYKYEVCIVQCKAVNEKKSKSGKV